jgi:UMF1 family MFS transporter
MNAGGASQMQERAVDAQRDGRFARVAWILLDWAASGFSTVLITLVVAYVKRLVMPDGWWGLEAGVIWAWTLAVAMLASALLTPAAAAWADRRDGHQRAVLAGTVVGAGGLVALAAVPTAAGGAVVAAVIAACVGFDMAQIVTARDRLGLTMAGSLRLAFAATAAWWLLFSLPAAVARFPGAASGDDGRQSRDLRGFARTIWAAARGEGEYRLAGVLAGAMLALGAIQTAISQFTSLAEQRFDLDGPTLVRLVLLVQAVALPGALAIGWLSLRFGRRAATDVCLGGWVAVLVLAWLVRTPAHLHGVAVLLALVLGGAQSLLRAAVAAAAPPGREGITFGLLQVGTKFAGFGVGVAFGVLQLVGGVPEAGLVAIGVQLAASWWLLRRIA